MSRRTIRTLVALVAALALSAIGLSCSEDTGEDPADAGGEAWTAASPVECGNKTCGSGEYCYVHGGCGADVSGRDVSRDCSVTKECIDVPDECDPKNHCTCDEVPSDCSSSFGSSCSEPRKITCYAV